MAVGVGRTGFVLTDQSAEVTRSGVGLVGRVGDGRRVGDTGQCGAVVVDGEGSCYAGIGLCNRHAAGQRQILHRGRCIERVEQAQLLGVAVVEADREGMSLAVEGAGERIFGLPDEAGLGECAQVDVLQQDHRALLHELVERRGLRDGFAEGHEIVARGDAFQRELRFERFGQLLGRNRIQRDRAGGDSDPFGRCGDFEHRCGDIQFDRPAFGGRDVALVYILHRAGDVALFAEDEAVDRLCELDDGHLGRELDADRRRFAGRAADAQRRHLDRTGQRRILTVGHRRRDGQLVVFEVGFRRPALGSFDFERRGVFAREGEDEALAVGEDVVFGRRVAVEGQRNALFEGGYAERVAHRASGLRGDRDRDVAAGFGFQIRGDGSRHRAAPRTGDDAAFPPCGSRDLRVGHECAFQRVGGRRAELHALETFDEGALRVVEFELDRSVFRVHVVDAARYDAQRRGGKERVQKKKKRFSHR